MLFFFFFRKYCFLGIFGGTLVLGRFWALGPPITVLTKIWNGVISRPKNVKTNQVCRHSLAAKTPTMKWRFFLEKSKNLLQTAKKHVVSTSTHNFAQPEVPGIYIIFVYIYIYHAGIQWYTMKFDMFTTSWCSSTKKIRWVGAVYQSNKSIIYYID